MSARELELPPPPRFTRPWYFARLRTAGWVAVVTVLVWVYADLHFTGTKSILGTVRIQTPPGSNLVALGKTDIPVDFTVKGRRYAVERFAKELSEAGSVLLYDAAKDLKPGQHVLQATDILNDMGAFARAGLEVISATPPSLTIEMDTLRLIKDVRVEFRHSGAELAGPAKVTPDRIDLRIPESQADSIDPAGPVLYTETVDLRGVAPDKATTMDNVAIQKPAGAGVARMSRDKVKVTLTVRQLTDKREFTVAVGVQAPARWADADTWIQYRLVPKDPLDWTRKITVVGPPIELQKLQAEKIVAFIVLTENDKIPTSSWSDGAVQVHLPAGSKLSLSDDPIAPVGYKLEKRGEEPLAP